MKIKKQSKLKKGKPIEIKNSKKKKSDQYWLDVFKIKPVEVRLERIQGK